MTTNTKRASKKNLCRGWRAPNAEEQASIDNWTTYKTGDFLLRDGKLVEVTNASKYDRHPFMSTRTFKPASRTWTKGSGMSKRLNDVRVKKVTTVAQREALKAIRAAGDQVALAEWAFSVLTDQVAKGFKCHGSALLS
jgi:hypothetical protein